MDKQYFVEFGHGPYANLLVDPTFKKAFDPTHTESRTNLINFLNDILGPQLQSPIENLYVAKESLNHSGSKESRASILDLHCTDMENRHFEVEVQKYSMKNFIKRIGYYASQLIIEQGEPGKDWNYKVNPVYILSILNFELFHDRRAIRRATTLDIETHEQILDSYNYTFIELPKISPEISEKSDEVQKWLFVLNNLDKLQKLPPAVSTHKFDRLLLPAKIANFNREELKQYEDAMRLEWDEYAIKQQKIEDQAKFEAKQAWIKEEQEKMEVKQAQIKEKQALIKEEQALIKEEQALIKEEQAQIKEEQAQIKEERAKIDIDRAKVKEEQVKIDVDRTKVKEELAKIEAEREKIDVEQTQINAKKEKLTEESKKLAKEKAQLQKEKGEILSLRAELERNLKENKRNK